MKLFGKKNTAPTITDPVEIARLKQEAIEYFRAGQLAKAAEAEESSNADLEGLPPEVREYKLRYRETMARLAKERSRDNGGWTPRPQSYNYPYPSSGFGAGMREWAWALGPAAAGLAIWMGSIAVTTSNFDSSDGAEYLNEMGYTDVHSAGSSVILPGLQGCDSNTDVVVYKYETVSPDGTDGVNMLVCKGLFKGATARRG